MKQNEMNKESHYLKDIHEKLLEMIKLFHQFCVENKIDYYILGGTCLGAYRHKGFIPWDDDIDVGIPRKQYDELINGIYELPYGLELFTYNNNPTYPYNFSKIININTTLIEQYYPDNVMGVFIDIFPLDGTNQNKIKERIKQIRIKIWNSALRNHYHTGEKDKLIKKIFQIISKKINHNFLHKMVDELIKSDSLLSSDNIANYLGAWWTKEIVKKEIFGQPTLYKFEDTVLFGPQRIEKYLEYLYGDYMELPPLDQRKSGHGFEFLDLNKPYTLYNNRS